MWNEVADSIQMKVRDDAALRARLATEESEHIAQPPSPSMSVSQRGGKLIIFGNGGSATDANDWAIDCVLPPAGYRPVPADLTLAGARQYYRDRQRCWHRGDLPAPADCPGAAEDVAVGISTSGGSRNIVMAMEEARKRNLMTVALLGNDGGEDRPSRTRRLPIIVRSDYIPRIQEVQASAYHVSRHPGGADRGQA